MGPCPRPRRGSTRSWDLVLGLGGCSGSGTLLWVLPRGGNSGSGTSRGVRSSLPPRCSSSGCLWLLRARRSPAPEETATSRVSPAVTDRKARTCLQQETTKSPAKRLAPLLSHAAVNSRPIASQPVQPRHHESPSAAGQLRHLAQAWGGGIQT